MNRARFEEIHKKYRDAKRKERNVDLLSLKLEIESFIKNLRATDEKNEDLLAEGQDMLIDLITVIEESHCQPFRPQKL
jgi:flagellar biosynthesis/type III secretory pathway chaperone